MFRSAGRDKRDVDGATAADPTVLVTSRPPRHRLDYVDQLIGDDSAGQAPRGVALECRTDPTRTHGIDVVHLTNASIVTGGDGTRARESIRHAKRFVKLLRRRRVALVRTLGGDETVRPASPAEAILNEAAVALISLTAPEHGAATPTAVIGHSHLRARFLGFPRSEMLPGRILVASHDPLPRTYEPMVKVFTAVEAPGWTLRIAGTVTDDLAESYTRSIAENPATISMLDEHLSDASYVAEVSRAEIVLVASSETYQGQSAIMLALSLDRPVLVEDSERTRSLADEVGPTWIRRFQGPLTAHTFETALDSLRTSPPTGQPDLDARDPNTIRAQYTAVFRSAAADH